MTPLITFINNNILYDLRKKYTSTRFFLNKYSLGKNTRKILKGKRYLCTNRRLIS